MQSAKFGLLKFITGCSELLCDHSIRCARFWRCWEFIILENWSQFFGVEKLICSGYGQKMSEVFIVFWPTNVSFFLASDPASPN